MGQGAKDGLPTKKPTGFLTNAPEIARALDKVCTGRRGARLRPRSGYPFLDVIEAAFGQLQGRLYGVWDGIVLKALQGASALPAVASERAGSLAKTPSL